MIKLKFIFPKLFLFLFISCVGRKGVIANKNRDVKLLVDINRFYNSPPPCGIQYTYSIYTAYVKDYQKFIFGDSILLVVQCKADRYPFVTNTSNVEVTLTNYLENLDGKAFYNFSDLSDKKVLTTKKYQVIDINFNSNNLLNR